MWKLDGHRVNFNKASDLAASDSGELSEINLNASILIVEDNSFCYYALTTILQQYQIEFDTAWDGEWAYEMVERRYNETGSTYKLIIMDLYLPNLSGLKATQKIISFLKASVE